MNKIDLKHFASYEDDFARWSAEQAELIRAGRFDEVDLENVAEEIDSLARAEKRQIERRISLLLLLLLRWYYQPEYRCGDWRSAIAEQRHRIAAILEDSPSLRGHPGEVLADEYEFAREKAHMETTVFLHLIPQTGPYTIEEVLDPEFWPGGK